MSKQGTQFRFFSKGSGKEYTLTLAENGKDVYCSCPAWRFSKLPAPKRTCKHIKALENMEDTHFQLHDGMLL